MNLKNEIGVIGIDDAPFNREDDEALLIGTYYRGNRIIDGIYFKRIKRDGLDSTEKIIEMVNGKHKTKINAIFLDGITFGGFNIANIYEINEKTRIPVVAVIDRMPNRQKMADALKKHFEDYEKRISLLNSFPEPEQLEGIYVQYVGIERDYLSLLIKKSRLRSKIPECLRISHLIGRGFLEL